MATNRLEFLMIVLVDNGLRSSGVRGAAKVALLKLLERDVEARTKEPGEAKLWTFD